MVVLTLAALGLDVRSGMKTAAAGGVKMDDQMALQFMDNYSQQYVAK